jgi:hypothetical protein
MAADDYSRYAAFLHGMEALAAEWELSAAERELSVLDAVELGCAEQAQAYRQCAAQIRGLLADRPIAEILGDHGAGPGVPR